MPYSKDHKKQSSIRILECAYRLFAARGFDATSIDNIMAEANLTRGAFYAHFHSKSELYREALNHAAINSMLTDGKPGPMSASSWLQELLEGYLHEDQINQMGRPCPLAFLATGVATKEPEVRSAYTGASKGMNSVINGYTESFSRCSGENILATTAMIIGGVAVARALDNTELTTDLLDSCREEAKRLPGIV